MDKWYNSRAGWVAYFKAHYDWVRPVVSFFSGSRAANQLDKYKDVDADSSDEELRIVYGILKQAVEDGRSDDPLHFLTGWQELTDLYCEAHILWKEEHASAT